MPFYASGRCRFMRFYSEAKKQVLNFSQCETELTSPLNDCQAVKHPWIVTSLPAEPLRSGKQANPLVIANC